MNASFSSASYPGGPNRNLFHFVASAYLGLADHQQMCGCSAHRCVVVHGCEDLEDKLQRFGIGQSAPDVGAQCSGPSIGRMASSRSPASSGSAARGVWFMEVGGGAPDGRAEQAWRATPCRGLFG
jgi:hypothetical protein